MSKLNISQAARITGKSRTTIHRKLKNGTLSAQGGLIDTSDLIRVFGAFPNEGEQNGTRSTDTKRVTTEQASVQAVHQIELLELKLENANKELALKDEINESLKDQIRLLEHKPNTQQASIQANTNTEQLENKIVNNLQIERKKEGRLTKLGRFLFDA